MTRWNAVRVVGGCLGVAGLLLAGGQPGRAQVSPSDLAEALRGAPDGAVRLRFAIEDGVLVCNDGGVTRGEDHRIYWGRHLENRECQDGEAQVRFEVRRGAVEEISRPEPTSSSWDGTDLGFASGPDAAALFLEVAREGPDRAAKRALVPAVLAREAIVWPGLLELARDRSRGSGVRTAAVFWLGQEAAATVNDELLSLAEDESEAAKIRDAAVFALSQRPRDEGVPALMELFRTSRDPRVKKRAIFWLAQSQDSRVLPFFEEILLASDGG